MPIDTDPSHIACRKTIGQLAPVLSSVGCFEETGTWSPLANRVVAIDPIGFGDGSRPTIKTVALSIPHCSDNRIWVRGVHDHVDHASLVVHKQDFLPCFSAVRRFVDAPFVVRSVEATERSDVNDIGVFRMNQDSTNLVRLLESHVFPSGAAIGRFINPIAIGDRVARICFTCSDPNNVGIVGVHCNGTNRNRFLFIKLMRDSRSMVDGLKDSTGSRSDVPE